MLRLIRRLKPGFLSRDSTATRLIAGSPLNDAEAMLAAFGSLRPTPARVRSAYFEREPAARPRLSHYFDAAYYLETNPDVAASGMDPYLHFLSSGWREGRDPHPLVDLGFLRAQAGLSPDAWDVAALAEALRTGRFRPHRLFDPDHYLASNDDVRSAGIPALEHFLRSGAAEGRRPNPGFDADGYCGQVPGAPADRYAAFLHLVRSVDAAAGRGADPVAGGAAPPLSGLSAAGASPGPRHSAPDFAGKEYVGSFDALEHEVAMGWAHHTSAPGERPLVEIVAEGRVVGRGRAAGPRSDLRDQGIGDGAYHFVIRLSRELADGRSHRLTARIAGGADAALNGSHEFRAAAAELAFDLMPVAETESLAAGIAPAGADAGVFAGRMADAALCLATGDTDAAVDALDALAADHPDHALVKLKQAEAALLRGRPDEAEKAYAVASRADATAAWALLGLGSVSRLRGDGRSAEDFYLQARKLAPGLAPLEARLCFLHSRNRLSEVRRDAAQGDVGKARAAVVAELVAAPEDPAVCRLAAAILSGADDRGPELRVDPVLADARRALVLLEAVLGHKKSNKEGA